jgi:ABC-type nitrate/sulfonate/bicarbonate transport system ATPase subunit/ABC-type nitrate/sulfonate/bicarbonate transport system permease component
VRQGEFIAIVGPSGCGKSTFMKLATGLRGPSRGRILIDGQPVTGPLKISGMAFQAPSLLPWRTTVDNVLLPLEIVEPYRSHFKAKRKEYEERARALLQKVGLAGYEDKFPWQLSGGMQQRASICRALIHEPKMLLLDEPFGALDAFTREELWCILRDLWTEQRFNVILVTHDLRESVFLADTVYVMSKSPGPLRGEKARSSCRARATWKSPTPRSSATSSTNCAGTSARSGRRRGGAAMKMNNKHFERWAPGCCWPRPWWCSGRWSCTGFSVPEFLFPSPLADRAAVHAEFKGPIAGGGLENLLGDDGGLRPAIVVGVLLGFLVGSSRVAYAAVYPLMVGFNAVPKAAIVPILVVWFGIGVGPGILTAFLISFFPITVNIATGLATLEPELEDVLRVLGAKRWDVLIKVGLPRSMPYFYASLKVAITLAFRRHRAGGDDGGRQRHRQPDPDRRQPAAHAAGLCRPGGDQRDGDGDVRAVQRVEKAHHRPGRTAARRSRMRTTSSTAFRPAQTATCSRKTCKEPSR